MCRGSPREWHHGALPGHISATHATQQGRANGFNTEARRHRDTEKCILDRIYRINRMGCPLSTFSTFPTRLNLSYAEIRRATQRNPPFYILYISYTVNIVRVAGTGRTTGTSRTGRTIRTPPPFCIFCTVKPANGRSISPAPGKSRTRRMCSPRKKPQIKFSDHFPNCTKTVILRIFATL